MPQANTEYGFFPKKDPHGVDGVRHRLRVAGTVGQKDTIRIPFQHLISRGVSRKYPQLTTVLVKRP